MPDWSKTAGATEGFLPEVNYGNNSHHRILDMVILEHTQPLDEEGVDHDHDGVMESA